MNEATPRSNLGRHLFGVAAVTLGLITLAWHVFNDWHLPAYIVYLAAAGEIFGGAAIQFRRTAKAGAAVLGAVYFAFALACVPRIVVAPRVSGSSAGTLGGGGCGGFPNSRVIIQTPRLTGEVVVPFAVTFKTLAWVSNPPRLLAGGNFTGRAKLLPGQGHRGDPLPKRVRAHRD